MDTYRLYTRVITRCLDCHNAEHRPAYKDRGVTWSCAFDERFEIDPTGPIRIRCPLSKCNDIGELL